MTFNENRFFEIKLYDFSEFTTRICINVDTIHSILPITIREDVYIEGTNLLCGEQKVNLTEINIQYLTYMIRTKESHELVLAKASLAVRKGSADIMHKFTVKVRAHDDDFKKREFDPNEIIYIAEYMENNKSVTLIRDTSKDEYHSSIEYVCNKPYDEVLSLIGGDVWK